MSGRRAAPAQLQAVTQAETAFGGRDETWATLAILWATLTPGSPNQALDGTTASPAESASASAVALDHPAAAAGQRLLMGDDPDPWRIRRVDHGLPVPGRMTLRLDRLT